MCTSGSRSRLVTAALQHDATYCTSMYVSASKYQALLDKYGHDHDVVDSIIASKDCSFL